MNNNNNWLSIIAENDDLWVDRQLEQSAFPSPIVSEYKNLRTLASAGNVYGALLQIKDLYETAIKVPIIMAWVIMEKDGEKDTKAYSEFAISILEKEMAMGDWRRTAEAIINGADDLHIPNGLKKVLTKTTRLFGRSIGEYPNVVNWRNKEIAHGAIKFEDSEEYKNEVGDVLRRLSDFFFGKSKYSPNEEYQTIRFCQGDKALTGSSVVDSDAEICLSTEGGATYETTPIISKSDNTAHFFESYRAYRRDTKYLDYYSGNNLYAKEPFFSEIYSSLELAQRSDADEVNSEAIWSEDEKILSDISYESDRYIKPVFILEELEELMDDMGKGVITLCMERGTGKTALASQMDGQFHKSIMRDAEIRVYHIKNGNFRGLSDFINSFNRYFERSYRNNNPRFPQIDDVNENSSTPAQDVADALKTYHKTYGMEYTIFVIDGIDEVTEDLDRIFDFIPAASMMADGTFMLLLTRFENEDTVSDSSRKRIIRAKELCENNIIEIKRFDERYTSMLQRYLGANDNTSLTANQKHMIDRADGRFLYLKILSQVSESLDWNFENAENVIREYHKYLHSIYGERFVHDINNILAILALTGSFSFEYCEMFFRGKTSIKTIGALNDVMPLLSAERDREGTVYRFANEEYYNAVRTLLRRDIRDCIEVFLAECMDGLYKYDFSRWHRSDIDDDRRYYIQNARFQYAIDTLDNIVSILMEDNSMDLFFANENSRNLYMINVDYWNGSTPQSRQRQIYDWTIKLFRQYVDCLLQGAEDINYFYLDHFFSYSEYNYVDRISYNASIMGAIGDCEQFDVYISQLINAIKINDNKLMLICALIGLARETHLEPMISAIIEANAESIACEEIWHHWNLELGPMPDFTWEEYFNELRENRTYRVEWYIKACNELFAKGALSDHDSILLNSILALTYILVLRDVEKGKQYLSEMNVNDLKWPTIKDMDMNLVQSEIIGKIIIGLGNEVWDQWDDNARKQKDGKKKSEITLLLDELEAEDPTLAVYAYHELREYYSSVACNSSEKQVWEKAKDAFLEKQMEVAKSFGAGDIEYAVALDLAETAEQKGWDIDIEMMLDQNKEAFLEFYYQYKDWMNISKPIELFETLIHLAANKGNYDKVKKLLREYCTAFSHVMSGISLEEARDMAYCDRASMTLIALLADSDNEYDKQFLKSYVSKIDETNEKIEEYYVNERKIITGKDERFYLDHMENLIDYLFSSMKLGLKPSHITSSTFLRYADELLDYAMDTIDTIGQYTDIRTALERINLPITHYFYARKFDEGIAAIDILLERVRAKKTDSVKEIIEQVIMSLDFSKIHFRILLGEKVDLDSLPSNVVEIINAWENDAFYKLTGIIAVGPDQYSDSVENVLNDLANNSLSEANTYKVRVRPIVNVDYNNIKLKSWSSNKRF